MSALEVFQTDAWSVRAELRDGEPWFVAADVCRALGIANSRDAVARLAADGVGTTDVIDSMGRTQRATVINEPQLYRLIFQSRRPEAERFTDWVTRDVLPAIRRTGTYTAPAAMPTHAEALRGWAQQLERADQLAAENAALAPKAALAEACIDAAGDMSVREAAQALTRDHGIVTGQNRLMAYLREIGWIDRNGHPYQRHIERGVVAVRVRSYDHPHTGDPQISTQVRVTPKGLAELHRRMNGAAA